MRGKLFIMSLSMMWLFIFIESYNFPFYIGSDMVFIGWEQFWRELLKLSNIVRVVSGILLLLAVIYTLVLKCYSSENKSLDLGTKVKRVTNKSQEYLSYISTIFTLISAMVADYSSIRDVLLLVMLIVFLYFTIAKASWYYANPLFAVLGFNVYHIDEEYKNSESDTPYLENQLLLIKGELSNNDTVRTYYITKGLVFGVVVK